MTSLPSTHMTEPQNQEAERHTLGALMLGTRAIDRVRGILQPEDFYLHRHTVIYRAALALNDNDVPIDHVTLAEKLDQLGLTEEAGGRAYVVELAYDTPSAGNVAHYAGIVREKALQREAMRACARAADQIAKGTTALTVSSDLVRKMDALQRKAAGENTRIADASMVASYYTDKILNPPSLANGVPTPFSFLRPLQPAWLYLLGGYQGEGKTVLLVQFLLAACERGKRVGVVSMEMTWEDLTDRIVSCHGVPYQEAISGRFSSDENKRVAYDVAERMQTWDLEIIDDPFIDAHGVRGYARAGKYDLLMIDHLHRLPWKERRDLELAVAVIKNTAKEMRIPVILLAQLKRGDGTHFPRPTMASFRESGMIEAEADVAWLLWRKRDERNERMSDAEFIVGKNRYGQEGYNDLVFEGDKVRFREAA